MLSNLMEILIVDCKTLLGVEDEDTLSVNNQLVADGNEVVLADMDDRQHNVESGVQSETLKNVESLRDGAQSVGECVDEFELFAIQNCNNVLKSEVDDNEIDDELSFEIEEVLPKSRERFANEDNNRQQFLSAAYYEPVIAEKLQIIKSSEDIRVDGDHKSSENINRSETTGDKDANAIVEDRQGRDGKYGCNGCDEAKSHSCSICSKKFRHYCNLKTHMLIHVGERSHNCDVCGKSFGQMSRLRAHANIHPVALIYRCKICGKDFQNVVEVGVHMNIHRKKGKKYCKICHTWCEQYKLKSHMAVHKQSANVGTPGKVAPDEKNLKCNLCEKVFKAFGTLNRHLLTHCSVKRYKCGDCGKGFAEKNKMTKHRCNRRSARVKCRCCRKEFGNRQEFEVHFEYDGAIDDREALSKAAKCCECGKEFKDVTNLRMHYLTHRGAKNFRCEICKESFGQIVDLTIHTKKHVESKPDSSLTCEEFDDGIKCDFVGESELRNRRPSGIKDSSLICIYCGESFADALRDHAKCHRDLQSVRIQVSTRADARKESSEGRQRRGESAFRQESGSASKHGKRLFCEYCGKEFGAGSNLRIHRMIHTGEKPYKCDVCQRGFIQRHTLKLHSRTHTGEKPYRCSVCSRCFARSYDLKRHEQLVHRKLD